jgi:hypothetical protein
MKLPAPPRRVKATPALILLAGCGTIVSGSPTAAGPDTVARADLLGPWEGRILEAGTDQPLHKVLVVGSFGYSRGVGLVAPAGAAVVEAETDADGRYHIEAPKTLPTGPSVRLDRFTLIAYLPGFVAYRSDRLLVGPEIRPRHDFTQRGNVVRLARLPAEIGHSRHLAFLGVWGGPARLNRALAWEFERAQQQSAPSP